MNCEDVVEYMTRPPAGASSAIRRAAAEHAAGCAECRYALRAVRALEAEGERSVPVPRDGLERAVAAAVNTAVPAPRRAVFWRGAAVGAAMAASLAVAAFLLWQSVRDSAGTAAPAVVIALDQTEDVNITLDTPVELAAAQIRVTLNGAIELAGFGDQREVAWSTDLAPGINQLTLPVVARGPAGGQVTVEVQHGAKRRQFVVDVRTQAAQATARPERA